MADYPIDQLKLAFAYQMVQEIVSADSEIDIAEMSYLDEVFPNSTLASCGFIDSDYKLTPRFHDAVRISRIELPRNLSLAQKLELVDTFLDASLSDADFHHREGHVLVNAALALGVTSAEFDQHLNTSNDVGSIDLPSPE
jgi:uncharacterized tellurite resistance protein B-like protein